MAGDSAGADRVRERYEDLVDALMGIEGVTPPHGGGGFGRSALRYRGKMFAMLVRGRLVLKLPAERVTELVSEGHGVAFDANKGTPMREWLSLSPDSALDWLALANEALSYAVLLAGQDLAAR
jgi:TfoX/Sxy family transcriptional regulator of competence genes